MENVHSAGISTAMRSSFSNNKLFFNGKGLGIKENYFF
jgi:hypothetical protein